MLLINNPISEELGCLRSSLYTNILLAIKKNENRGMKNLRFFEIGPIFYGSEPGDQDLIVSGIITGYKYSKDWLENLEIKELISFNPVIRDGEVLGIRVNPVKSSPFFQDDNLEPGDILTSFNGQKVTTVDLERELNQKVRNIEVGVIRDGSPITLTINLN